MAEKVVLNVDGATYELPLIVGSENEQAIDIGNLRSETGLTTIDVGYKNTGSTQSATMQRSPKRVYSRGNAYIHTGM